MKRRSLLKAVVAGAGAAVAAPAISKGRLEWRMVTSWPKGLPGLGTGAERLAANITAMSGGRLAIKVYAADIDLDGDTDVLGSAYYGNELILLVNDGGSPPSWERRVVDGGFVEALAVSVVVALVRETALQQHQAQQIVAAVVVAVTIRGLQVLAVLAVAVL